MRYEMLQVVEMIPCKNEIEKKKVIRKYHKNSIIEDCDKYIYVERIEIA